MKEQLENDIRESLTFLLKETKDKSNFIKYTYPWTKENVLRKLSFRALLEIFPDYKASELIEYYEILAYCQTLIELSSMEDE